MSPLAVAFLLAAFWFTPVAVYAQGCAMCYASAAAQSAQGIRALNLGILILLIPTVVIFGGIFLVTYRRRDSWAGVAAQGARLDVGVAAQGARLDVEEEVRRLWRSGLPRVALRRQPPQ